MLVSVVSEDIPLGVGNSHCDTTTISAAQLEFLDLHGAHFLHLSPLIIIRENINIYGAATVTRSSKSAYTHK